MNEKEKDQLIKRIVIERLKTMAPTVKIALGGKTGFLSRDDLLKEVTGGTDIGDKIVAIQKNI